MRRLILMASVAAMAVSVSAMAKPGSGGGHGAAPHAGVGVHGGPASTRGSVRTDAGHGAAARTSTRIRINRTTDLDRDGIPDYRDRHVTRVDRNHDGIDDRVQGRYGANACPPGLAAKDNGCLPPGQARRMFSQGDRLPSGYNFYTPYADIPNSYRTQYGLDPSGRYIYRDGRIYDVDPTTLIVRRILEGL